MRNIFNLITLFILLFFVNSNVIAQIRTSYKVASPDKITNIEIGVNTDGKLMYRVHYSGKEVINWSGLGIQKEGITTSGKTVVKNKTLRSNRENFAWSLGEDDMIINNYNEIKLSCSVSTVQYNLIVRIYDGSVAFRYELTQPSELISKFWWKENTTFNFAEPLTIYQYNQESVFTPTLINDLTKTCDFPATLTNGKLYISIGEAENLNYTKAELRKGTSSNSLMVFFVKDTSVVISTPFQTPWRTVSFAKSAIGLHAYSQLFIKLAKPSGKPVPAWIKPGKLIRAQLNTQSGLDCIDFAVKNNLQYIMFDAGWYGAEFRSGSDPTQVIPAIDMPKVIQYGKDNGIGVILYVNYVGLKAKLDTILPLYKKWGVSGMKFGFVDGATQKGISWVVSAIKKVNDIGFILDIHDNWKPTGLSRSYPALLTQEGIRGDENSPDPFHTTVLPFTRFLAGPADFTFCYANTKNSYSKNLKVSKAQQLALTVVYFSPLQSFFWYGQPKDYTNELEIEFFKYVPTVWNESHYLAGDIGKNVSVARRKGDTWFVGNISGFEDWKSSINLNFLTKGKTYTATVYEDDNAQSISKRTVRVKKGDVFSFDIKAKGGQALIIKPVSL